MFSFSPILRKPPRGFCLFAIRQISRDPHTRVIPELDSSFIEGFENGTMTFRKHPGKVPRDTAEFDDKMLHTIEKVLLDTNKKKLLVDAKKLCNYLSARQPPLTRLEYEEQKLKCSYKVIDKTQVDPSSLSEQDYDKEEKRFSKKVNKMMKQNVYNWQPVEYTTYVGKQYLINRMIAEYAALKRIFSELALRNPDFKPTSLFDFGSGVGTVTWTVRNLWPNVLKECYNVDSSADMNSIAELLLKNGNPEEPLPIPQLYYRQFLNADSERKYNLVVSSYTLLDLPSQETRLKTISNLWSKTQEFLVLVEKGTSAGFKLIHEARQYLLEADSLNENSSGIHIFSPCSHELTCPQKRYTDRPCCFKASYMLPPIGRRKFVYNELYSFVVFRKGKKPENEKVWPRVLKKAVKKKGRARCRLCCPDGKMRIVTFTKKKHGKDTVTLLRTCQSCDRFPATLREVNMDFDDDSEVIEVSSNEDLASEFNEESDDEANTRY